MTGRGETPRFARGDRERSVRGDRERGDPSLTLGATKKEAFGETGRVETPHCVRGDIPYPVLPRHASAEGSLTSFGTTLYEETPRLAPRGDRERVDPSLTLGATKRGAFGATKREALGATKGRARGDKKRGVRSDKKRSARGRQKGARGDKKGALAYKMGLGLKAHGIEHPLKFN